ncbi:hypothetical protein ABVT39_004407 [Epinephelus coioides]
MAQIHNTALHTSLGFGYNPDINQSRSPNKTMLHVHPNNCGAGSTILTYSGLLVNIFLPSLSKFVSTKTKQWTPSLSCCCHAAERQCASSPRRAQSAAPSVTERSFNTFTGFERQQEWINWTEQGVHAGEVRTRTRSASAPSVYQQTKCLGAGHPQVTSTTTGAKQ